MADPTPGLVALLGSGETAPASRPVYERLVNHLGRSPQIAILETPAGFEQNASRVADRVAEFLRVRLQNYAPTVVSVPARRRGSAWSPDDPATTAAILSADMVFMGPGSPTYA